MLSDNGCTYISRISADVDIAPATNHNKPYYILIIMHKKLSNYTLHEAAYDGICAETIQTTMRVSPKLYELLDEKFVNRVSNNADFSITGRIEMLNIIL